MHLKNQPPVLVPSWELIEEMEKMSKAALMDMAWSFATRISGQEEDPGMIMNEFRRERDAILAVRKSLKGLPT